MDCQFEKAQETPGRGAAVRSDKSNSVNVPRRLDREFRGSLVWIREGAAANARSNQGRAIIRRLEGHSPGLATIGCDLNARFQDVLIGE